MKVFYRQYKNFLSDLKIEFCCEEMEKWFNEGSIKCNCQNEIWIMGKEDYEYTFGERIPLFKIQYCPFCGERIKYKIDLLYIT